MTAKPPRRDPQERSAPSIASTVLAIGAGWALLQLVAGGRRTVVPRASGLPAQAGRQSQPVPEAADEQHAPASAAAEPGRGRQADTPAAIPAKGWKDILWRTYEEFGQDRLMSVAAGVTYYALLALFPALAALVSLYGLFADPATIRDNLVTLSSVLPGGAIDLIGEQVSRIASASGGALGLSFFVGLAVSLWSANAGMKAIFDALNIVYDEEEKRSFLWLNVQSLTFTLGAIAFLLLALAGIVILPVVLDFVGLRSSVEWLLSLMRWPILLAAVILGLAVLYRYGPSRDKARWTWVTPGSLVAAVLWLVASMLFSWYVANFGSYNETYGSLGAVIGFMTWIWISGVVVLLGAEINAEMEHQTAKDTTTGPDRPMGQRGATMADTLGQAKA
ncbi:YihY/virulence factor BrkB family protein [Microvirga mediterraneensis]|uniref:YihY/virulence factor BrkB family protein n=1 Tax=Microvirga mediterraneensis TaxID=2754695 RepID=A0A838BVJ2_9HYPH|nr:YihY/virulence factor BrkB family protein [Microvirga mediterraneensis]MBA1159122.1 YihY/virulence factor BrkB family protein [Microvirga mediterraneensis]